MTSTTAQKGNTSSPRLLDQVRGKIRLKHYCIRTEQSYTDWIKRFIRHFGKRHPRELGAAEMEQFLTHLAVAGKVAASTQNQAKSALLFLYREVLEVELPWLDNIEQAKAPKRLPVVLTVNEVQSLLSRLEGTHWLIANLLYGTGMRVMEALRLRVMDVDFQRNEIMVRDGKGSKDRVTMLPLTLKQPLQEHSYIALRPIDGSCFTCGENKSSAGNGVELPKKTAKTPRGALEQQSAAAVVCRHTNSAGPPS